MPLPGGHSDKLGNEFEGWWTASIMLDLLHCETGVICLEPLGDAGEKIEFWVERDGVREVHQVKRQNHFDGRWTQADLNKKGLLRAFKTHLSDGATHAHFVSTQSVEGLAELTERAQQTSDEAAYRAHYLTAQAAISANTTFGKYWGGSSGEQYAALRRIHLHSISDPVLRSMVRAQVALWFDESAEVVVGALAGIAIERISQMSRPFDIWNGLERRGIRRRLGSDVSTLSQLVEAQTKRYLAGGHGVGGQRLVRSEVAALVDDLCGDIRVAWLVGTAGSGKSEVARDLVRALPTNWPTLALRLDLLEPTGSARQLGEQVGLRLEPAHAVAVIAQGGDALLLIDQLDAVSIVSGRRRALLDAVRELVDAASHYANLRVVVVCRQFDLDNDHQLRRLRGNAKDVHMVSLGALRVADVQDMVRRLSVDTATLTAQQLELLSLPLHLSMYADVVSGGEAFSEFATPGQLFEQYCRLKRRAVGGRLGVDSWTDVTTALVGRMSRDELLSVPWRILSAWAPFAEGLVSEHVLVRTGNRVAFFHESLFDYLFGLRFDPALALVAWLRGDEQGLFRRAQVRQILAFRRDDDRKRYIADLRDVLLQSNVRFHLVHLVLHLLGQVVAPDSDEVEIVLEFLRRSEDSVSHHALSATAAKGGWFHALRDCIRQMLDSEDIKVRSMALWWFRRAARQFPNEVAGIIAPLVSKGGDWPTIVGNFVTNCRGFTAGNRFVDMVVHLVQSGALDRHRMWLALTVEGQADNVDWSNTGRIVQALFRRNLDLANERGTPVELVDNWAFKVVRGLASADPVGFVERLLPIFIGASQGELRGGYDDSFPRDRFPRVLRGEDGNAWASLATTLASGIAHLIGDGNERGLEAVKRLSTILTQTPQEVAALALTRAAAHVADESISWLLADQHRLSLREGITGEYHSRNLIAAASLMCSPSLFQALEARLLSYYTTYERKTKNRKEFGRRQWLLVSALPQGRLSEQGRTRLQELTRKFHVPRPRTKPSRRAFEATSPIERASIARMSDDDWVRAITKHRASEMTWDADGKRVGGAAELAQELQTLAAEEPVRFAAFAHRIAKDAPPTYLSAVLAGVKNCGLGVDALEGLIALAEAIPNRPHRRLVLDLVQTSPTLAWSDATLEMIASYAMNDPDPEQEQEHGGFRQMSLAERAHFVGINSVRGRASECLGLLVEASAERLDILRPAIEAVVVDEHDAVRCCAAVACQGLLRHDVDLAISLTATLLGQAGPARGTPPVERLISYVLPVAADELVPLLEAMLTDASVEIVAVAARRVCLAALSDERLSNLAERCINGTEVQREAAATILSANITVAPHRQFCERALIELFRDPNEQVRKEAASCFRMDKTIEVTEFAELASIFVESPAFADDIDGLVFALERSNGDCSSLIADVAHGFLDLAANDAGNVQKHAAMTSHLLQPLVVRSYVQSAPGSDTRQRCLDAIDRMFRYSVYDLETTIEKAGR